MDKNIAEDNSSDHKRKNLLLFYVLIHEFFVKFRSNGVINERRLLLPFINT